MDFEHLMAVEKENNCAARVLSVHDRGLRRRHIEERRQLQRWKDGDIRTTFIVMAETQPLCPPPGRTNVAYFNDHMKSLTWPDKKAWVKSEEEFDKKQTREVLAEYHSRIAKAENVK